MSRLAVAALSCAALAVAGCGSGERVFEAGEFVDEANAAGAGIELGERLVSTREGIEVHGFELTTGGGGSLTVTPDSAAATEEYERCDGSAALRCYRVANVVLGFEEEDLPRPDALTGVDAAVRALASD